MSNLSYIKSDSKYYVEYKTIPQHLKERAELQPDKEAVIFYSHTGVRESITFSEMYSRSRGFGHALSGLGIKKGDRVIICLYNSIEWIVIAFGLMIIGAVPVGCYIIRNDASDLDYVIEKTNAVGIIFTGLDSVTVSGLRRLLEEKGNQFKYAISTEIDEDDGVFKSYRKLVNKTASDQSIDNLYIDPDDEAFIMRSSGSTGRPKLVSHSHLNMSKYTSYLMNPNIMLFSNCEFSWAIGSPILEVCSGNSKVTMSGDSSSITADEMLQYAAIESCNMLQCTSDVINTICQDKLKIPTCVKSLCLGGCPINKKLQVLLEHVEGLYCGYGSLEMCDMCGIVVKKGMELDDCVGGYPLPGVEVKIVKENNKITEVGQVGKIFVRSDAMLLGYVGDEDISRKAISQSRWFNTDDIGYVTQDGKLIVLGRTADCVTVGTVTTYVSEIERVLRDLSIGQVSEVIVVPVPDKIQHEAICGCFIMDPGQSVTEEELLQVINDMIGPSYYQLKYVIFIDSFPRNKNGKINRQLLQEFVVKKLFGYA